MKTPVLFILPLLILLDGKTSFAQSDHILWYSQPALYFEQSIPLGNGKMGACVYGGVDTDQILLNDATLWSGEPVNPNMNPDAYKNLSAVRDALKNENYALADQLNKKLQGKFSESYLPLGTLLIQCKEDGKASSYRRELDIANAVSTDRYEVNGVKYSREYFISHPDGIMVIRLNCSKKGALNFNLHLGSLIQHELTVKEKTLMIKGQAPVVDKPNYLGNSSKSTVYEPNRGIRFAVMARIKSIDGKLTATDSTLSLSGATGAIIFISEATSFNGFDKNPATEGLDEVALASGYMNKAFTKSFAELKKAHETDYRKYSGRVELNLGKTTATDLPTDERLKRYAEGKEDKNLEVLYFQYGRYLLISSSRTPAVPANLQGIWNPYMRPPWSSNYTTNINLEENYWLAENTNLPEMHVPLLQFIGNLSQTGKVTARTFYGVDGWCECHNSDIWAMTNPVGDFGSGDPVWANWNMGGAWLSTHLWEHYLFTQDKDFLKNYAYPILKGAAQFCLGWLVEDANGNLITSPSTSPENKYVTPQGYHGATFYGGTADIAIIRACMQQAVDASSVLGLDEDFRKQLESAISRLRPYQIGKKGNLQEWYYDWNDEDPQHRHQSHLYGLFPGHQITPYTTPELANACRKTLEIKGDESTGWSKAWRINLWARLGDGNHAYKMYRELLHYVEPDGMRTNYSNGGGTYPNLFDAHPPFQIDGNFGGAAAVAEMLVQSTEKEIRLLPALPDAWAEGSVKGICARGGFVISMDWNNKNLQKVTISSEKGGNTTLICGNKQLPVSLKEGEKVTLQW